jgi:hypothetical protein
MGKIAPEDMREAAKLLKAAAENATRRDARESFYEAAGNLEDLATHIERVQRAEQLTESLARDMSGEWRRISGGCEWEATTELTRTRYRDVARRLIEDYGWLKAVD